MILNGGITPYKSYIALISQSGTSAPTAKVLYNDIGTITWSYVDVGSYRANSSALFKSDKTVVFCSQPSNITTLINTETNTYTPNQVFVGSQDVLGSTAANSLMTDISLEIRIYS